MTRLEVHNRFCASCTREESADDNIGLEFEWYGGKYVPLCRDCREGALRGGRWSFGNSNGQEVLSRSKPTGIAKR